ncbi:hypothetical protein [Caulobacter sp.]|uniref:hypothetical protein n=1 Tax=Caulobacter sp. TaxID=78 RepID=UPI002B48E79D|nr:hypothetical protein [Caulobacter sp.]HJV40942.1 hypothetical protein [Caulobacter sp.]
MTSLLTINAENLQRSTQSFYIFQEPSIYSGGQTVYINSLYCQTLGNYESTGATLTFQANMQSFAAIQQAHSYPVVGQPSGFASAFYPIDLAPTHGATNHWTTASVAPLGLTRPTAGVGVRPGAFRITTPSYSPPAFYNIGSAVQINGGLALSNFVIADPVSDIDCQPILQFYVQTGRYMPGMVTNFNQAAMNAALCDFTGGHSVINVTLNPDGSWTTRIIL